MDIQDIKLFPLSQQTIQLAKNLMEIQTIVRKIHPIVKSYQKKILEELKAKNNETGEDITNPEWTYLLDDSTFNTYLARCEEEAQKHKLIYKPGNCPLLEAENKESEIKRAFGEHIIPLLPGYEDIEYDDLIQFSYDKKGKEKRDKLGRIMLIADEFIDLSLNLIVSYMHSNNTK